MKNKNLIISIGIAVAILLVFIFVALPIYRNAEQIGEEAGKLSGQAVGTAVGSFKGVTEKYPKGLEDGKAEGLSAKDTKVELKNSLAEMSNLEVMVASVKLDNYHEVGDKYAALYLMKADAVFTVDFANAKVDMGSDNQTLYITLKEPEVTVYIDEEATEKALSWQKHFFSGNAEDGFDAYINSMANVETKAKSSILSDESLMQSARNSAETQITQLAGGICLNNEKLIFVWE